MSSTASPAPSAFAQTVDADLKAFADSIGGDAVKQLKSTVNGAGNNILANPTGPTAVLQGGLLIPSLIAAGPVLETDGIVGFVKLVQGIVNAIPDPTS